jgi:hypothetical protein
MTIMENGHLFVRGDELGLQSAPYLICKRCGVVRPRNGAVNDCKGAAGVDFREAKAQAEEEDE